MKRINLEVKEEFMKFADKRAKRLLEEERQVLKKKRVDTYYSFQYNTLLQALKEAYEEIDKLEKALSIINSTHFPKE